jgi:hypothetical protein
VTPKIVLDVKRITLADRSGYTPANVFKSDEFTPTISDAIKGWARDHLQAGGQSGQAIVLIKKASLSVKPLPLKDGIDSWFTRQQSEKYLATAEVSIEANGPGGFAVADADASRGVTMGEDPTVAEKHVAYNTMLNGLMKDLQENLQSSVHAHMANFLSPSGGGIAPVGNLSAQPMEDLTNDLPPSASPQMGVMPSANEPLPLIQPEKGR